MQRYKLSVKVAIFGLKKELVATLYYTYLTIERDKNFADLFLICTFVYAIFY